MMRYFLGLALALLAIPGVSRADVTGFITNTTGTAGAVFDTTGTFTKTFNFDLNLSSTNLDSITIFNSGAYSISDLTFTLKQGVSTVGTINVGSASANDPFYSLATADTGTFSNLSSNTYSFEISGNLVSGALKTNSSNSIDQSGGNGIFSNSSFSGSNIQFTLGATAVPEPATMILTGSVLAVGFGASVVRRLRKKSEEQAAF